MGSSSSYIHKQSRLLDVICQLRQHEKLGLDVTDGNGDAALLWACRSGHCDVVRELLKEDTRDLNSSSAAYANGHLDVVYEFLNQDAADVNACSLNGTPTDWKAKNGFGMPNPVVAAR